MATKSEHRGSPLAQVAFHRVALRDRAAQPLDLFWDAAGNYCTCLQHRFFQVDQIIKTGVKCEGGLDFVHAFDERKPNHCTASHESQRARSGGKEVPKAGWRDSLRGVQAGGGWRDSTRRVVGASADSLRAKRPSAAYKSRDRRSRLTSLARSEARAKAERARGSAELTSAGRARDERGGPSERAGGPDATASAPARSAETRSVCRPTRGAVGAFATERRGAEWPTSVQVDACRGAQTSAPLTCERSLAPPGVEFGTARCVQSSRRAHVLSDKARSS